MTNEAHELAFGLSKDYLRLGFSVGRLGVSDCNDGGLREVRASRI